MKNSKFKRLMVSTGLVFIASIGMAHANNTNTSISLEGSKADYSIISQVNDILEKQYSSTHILSKEVNTHIKISDTIGVDDENSLKMENGKCELNLSYKNDGSIVKLTQNDDILKFTEAQNITQQQYQREFIALHEASHCEFSTIENPIRDSLNNSVEFTKQLNYEMKDRFTYIEKNAEGKNAKYYGYIMGLNETFADTLAAIGMIKSYNSNESLQQGQITNNDLNHVLQSVIAQREANYIERVGKNIIPDDHFSQESLKELLKPENLKKLSSLNTNDEIKEFALNLSNNGIQKSYAHTSYSMGIYLPSNNEGCSDLLIYAISQLNKNPKLTSNEIIKSYNPNGEVINTLSTDTFTKIFNTWSNQTKNSFTEIKESDLFKKSVDLVNEIHLSKEYSPMLEGDSTRSLMLDLRKLYPHQNIHKIQESDIKPMLEIVKEDYTKNLEINSKFTIKSRINEIRDKALGNSTANQFKIK